MALTLLGVNATIKKMVTLDFSYDDPSKNYSIDIVGNKIYKVYFVYENELIQGIGTVKDIIVQDDKFTLVLDCSTNYNSNVIHIRQDLIRGVEEYVPGPSFSLPEFEEEEE